MASQTSAVIINWNGARFLEPLLRSVQGEHPAAIIVVDNASTDGSAEILSRYPDVKAVFNNDNAGFGAAANQGIALSATPYVLVLNVDLVARPGSIGILQEFIERNPDVGIVAPQLLFPDGSLQVSCRTFPTIPKLALYLSYLDHVIPTGYRLRRKRHFQTMEVDQPMGAALLIRMSALQKSGAFDPIFSLYMEEVDLCNRLKASGWRIVYLPDAQMVHYAGGSTAQDWEQSQIKFFQNVIRYFEKRSSRARLLLLRCALAPALLFRVLVLLLLGRPHRSWFYLKMCVAIFRF